MAEEEKKVRESNGEECNMLLKNTIEGIIIKWAHQIDEVLRIIAYQKHILLKLYFSSEKIDTLEIHYHTF